MRTATIVNPLDFVPFKQSEDCVDGQISSLITYICNEKSGVSQGRLFPLILSPPKNYSYFHGRLDLLRCELFQCKS